MSDDKEKIKQRIVIELESARFWGSFFLPSTGLILAILFTDDYFPGWIFAKVGISALLVIWIQFAVCQRNDYLRKASNHIKEL